MATSNINLQRCQSAPELNHLDDHTETNWPTPIPIDYFEGSSGTELINDKARLHITRLTPAIFKYLDSLPNGSVLKHGLKSKLELPFKCLDTAILTVRVVRALDYAIKNNSVNECNQQLIIETITALNNVDASLTEDDLMFAFAVLSDSSCTTEYIVPEQALNECAECFLSENNESLLITYIKQRIKVKDDTSLALIKMVTCVDWAPINYPNTENYSPLLLACREGDLDLALELLQHEKIDIEVKTSEGQSPLMLAKKSMSTQDYKKLAIELSETILKLVDYKLTL
ncbi:hypothetical protein JQC92_03230 [Shewanella sp. 202IG2-18]|uniref:hypothetical protein n=1 Tax=Parashewanella hymeniacidonis TaxID=2807618 RepID=UPI0019608D89|nr:hypothetical protein [Parashewanella hymeniacidonis]MBM7071055.1 hypothetical protein [Parashewanella hymeniacidonis]